MSRIYPDLSNARANSELLHKIQMKAEMVPKQTCICGHRYNTCQLLLLIGLLLLSTISLTGTVLMWCTSSFDKVVLDHLTLKSESDALRVFEKPLTSSFMKIHIFNYTNVQDYMDLKDDKLKVKDLGPYVYERFMDRVNVQHNDDGTLTYQERSIFEFRADLSKGRRQSDKVIIPDVPMLTAAARGQLEKPIFQWGMSQLYKFTESQPFKEVGVHKFLFGYADKLYSLAQQVSMFSKPLPSNDFGLLANKNGTSEDLVTINTGVNGFDKYGYITNYNGESEVPHWSTAECRKIEGSDGTIFPPFKVRSKKRIYWYAKDFCRRMPMDYEKEVKIYNGTVTAYRYQIPDDVFAEPQRNHENQCYCNLDSSVCPPHGVFNTTPCAFDAPTFISFPHFYLGDERLINAIEGLKPNPNIHKSYLDLHPTMGFLLSGYTRIQINVQVKKSFAISQLERFEDDMILPIAWLDIGLDETHANEKVMDLIYETTFAVQGYELAFKYGFLLTHLMTIIFLVVIIKSKYSRQQQLQSYHQTTLLHT